MASISHDATASIVAQTELVVIVNPYNFVFSEFVGSRAMLESEGILPDRIKWPEGYDDLHWQEGQFDYVLRRQRPEGDKGPRRDFANCDWWRLRWKLTNAPSPEECNIMRKTKALNDEIYLQSAQGRAEWNKNWNRYREAIKDEKFQAFKALIPGLVRPKRGRRPKIAEQSQGESQ